MPRRLLLIDDDRLQARLVQQHLATFPHQPFTFDWASTFEDGLARLLSGEYAVCLLDYQLGPRNGLDLLREARAQGNLTPVVFLTAESGAEVDHQAMDAGAHDYLVKGEITPRLLERSLRYALKLGETLEALRQLATHDQLTGLLNRREFDRILAEESERARRFQRPFALILIDLDHFKRINDTLGHPTGDAILRAVALILQAQVREVDRVLRYGGEEFAVFALETERAAALEIAQRLCTTLAQTPIQLASGTTVSVTISIGVATMPDDAATGADLLAQVDRALYAAKKRGRNRVVSLKNL